MTLSLLNNIIFIHAPTQPLLSCGCVIDDRCPFALIIWWFIKMKNRQQKIYCIGLLCQPKHTHSLLKTCLPTGSTRCSPFSLSPLHLSSSLCSFFFHLSLYEYQLQTLPIQQIPQPSWFLGSTILQSTVQSRNTTGVFNVMVSTWLVHPILLALID